MKKINQELINNDYLSFDKKSLYQRIDTLITELKFKNVYEFSPDKVIYNLANREALPNFKTIFYIWHVCKQNGKDLDLNWFCGFDSLKTKNYRDNKEINTIAEELEIKYLTATEKLLKDQLEDKDQIIKNQAEIINIYKEKLNIK